MNSDLKNNSVKILIVDDKQSNLIAMQAAFQGCGYHIIEAISGKEALKAIKDHEFACILLDVQMPVMDGFETAILIRREQRAKTTPIIFVTAIHRTEEFEHQGYKVGAVDYLLKPFNVHVLQSKVAIFAELYLQAEEIKRQRNLLTEVLVKVEENKKLKEELATRDQFLLMASHELKTPITPLTLQMQTFIKLFKDGSFQSLEPNRILRMLETSQGQVERLSRLINELVDVSRISTDKLQLNLEVVGLNALLQKVMADFHEEIKHSGCEVNLREDEEVIGFWDSFRLEQVIINLLINALKYGAGKPINIVVSKVNSQTARFCIHDNGIGIAKEDQVRIFQRFERAVSPKSFNGLGLGLYITEQIVLLHKGRVHVESEPNHGATFIVELPISERPIA